MDAYFAKKAPNPDITEWYSTQEMQEKFGMTLSAIYCFVSKNAIPKKKEGIMVYYSKKHVDIAKGVATIESPYSFAPNKCKTLNIKQYVTHVYKSNSSPESDSE